MNSSENFARQEGGDHRRFCNCGDTQVSIAVRDADRMTIHATFAKKLAGSKISTTASLPCSDMTVSMIFPV
jgi:hypothetical protein